MCYNTFLSHSRRSVKKRALIIFKKKVLIASFSGSQHGATSLTCYHVLTFRSVYLCWVFNGQLKKSVSGGKPWSNDGTTCPKGKLRRRKLYYPNHDRYFTVLKLCFFQCVFQTTLCSAISRRWCIRRLRWLRC